MGVAGSGRRLAPADGRAVAARQTRLLIRGSALERGHRPGTQPPASSSWASGLQRLRVPAIRSSRARWRGLLLTSGGRSVPRVERDGLERRAIGHWNSTASSATQQWLACPRAPSGGLSLFSTCRCRGKRPERCRCGATHFRGGPNISGNTVIYGNGGSAVRT